MRRVRLVSLSVAIGVAVLADAVSARGFSPRDGSARDAQSPIREAGAAKLTETITCAARLGVGTKSGRTFCDAIIAPAGTGSIVMPIPRHSGAATLLFDLHMRVEVPSGVTDPGQAFARHTALVAILGPAGEVLDRAAIAKEYRTPADLFDRLRGTLAGGVKAVAPGRPDAVRVTVPAGLAQIAIVGVRLEVVTRAGHATHDRPGVPVAIVSNARIQYRP